MSDSVNTETLEMLKEIIGDDLKEILNNFIETSPETLEQLKRAIKTKNAEDLRLHAHTIKGSSANIGATKLPDLSFILETKGKDNVTSNLEAEVIEVEEELKGVISFLKSYVERI